MKCSLGNKALDIRSRKSLAKVMKAAYIITFNNKSIDISDSSFVLLCIRSTSTTKRNLTLQFLFELHNFCCVVTN